MKKIILFLLLLCAASFAQITVVGDTIDIKLNQGSGVILLEEFGKGNHSGGGLFHRIDSTYAEGRDAFDYYVPGYQWARIGYVEYSEQYISTQDTVVIATDSTYYLVDFWSDGYIDGATTSDSSVTLISDAYYTLDANFSFQAQDSTLYSIAVFVNDVLDTSIHVLTNYDNTDDEAEIRNVTLSGIVYSDGNDVFKVKIAALEASITDVPFIIRKANIRYKKIN
jgi:hypothetical protein